MPDDLQRLQLAFAYHMIREVVGADAELVQEELDYLDAVFPKALLRKLGFIDGSDQLTPAFEEARDAALYELPDRLTLGEKLGLVELLVGASAADGLLTAEEVDALAASAGMLGVPTEAWSDHLEQLLKQGGVRRDEAGV